MGFFDFLSSLFGGGAKMAMSLESQRVPVGGFLSGKATLTGAPKDTTVTSLKVRLLYVHVEQQEDSALPKIDTRVLIDHTVASNIALPANDSQDFDFTLTIPPGTEPTAHNVSYSVVVVADIPSMKDPSAKADLEVVEGAEGGGLTAESLYQRWPALRGSEDQPLLDALRDMRWKHREGDAEDDLTVAEPILSKLMRQHANNDVKKAAFESWTNIVSDHLRTEHVAAMGQILAAAEGDDGLLVDVLRAMGPSMDLGGDALVMPYLQHASPKVRGAAVGAMDWGQGGSARAQALLPMVDDSDDEVRARAIGALGDYKDQPGVLDKIIEVALVDSSGEVLQKSLGALAIGWTQDDTWQKVQPVYERARTHFDPEVRKAYVDWIAWPARKTDITAAIQGLLDDPEPSVQEAMAFEFCNLLRDKPEYAELCKAVIHSDKSDKVRGRAIGALDEVMKPVETAALYREILAGNTSEELEYQMVQGIKFTTESVLKELLLDFSRDSAYGKVQRAAKSAYEADYS